VSCEVTGTIRSERIFIYLKRHYNIKHEKSNRKYHGTSRESILKKVKGNQARNQRGATGQLSPHKRLCIEDVLPMFVFCERAFSIRKRLKSDTKQNGWWNLHARLRLLTTEIKTGIDFITKTKKNCIVNLLVCCVSFFYQKISILSRKQTENLKITLESKIALGVQQNLGLLEQQTSFLTTMEFLFLRPANFSSNRNAALHACSLRPPCTSIIKLYPVCFWIRDSQRCSSKTSCISVRN